MMTTLKMQQVKVITFIVTKMKANMEKLSLIFLTAFPREANAYLTMASFSSIHGLMNNTILPLKYRTYD